MREKRNRIPSQFAGDGNVRKVSSKRDHAFFERMWSTFSPEQQKECEQEREVARLVHEAREKEVWSIEAGQHLPRSKRGGDVERVEDGTRRAKKTKPCTATTRPGGATTGPMDTGDGGDGGDDRDGGGGSDGLDGSMEAMDIGDGADSDGDSINEGSGDDGPGTTPMEIGGGGGGGGGAGTGGGGAGGGGRTSGEKTGRVNKPVGQRGLRSTTLAQELEEPILPCLGPFLENNRRASNELVEERNGTAPRTPNKPAGAGTMADAARFLALLSEDKTDGIKIKEGVYFPRSSKSAIESQYGLDYAFNPSDIGVVVGSTTVMWKGKVRPVEAFDYGWYTLGDKEPTEEPTKLTQWQVLENRSGSGVTLEEDLRRYIGQLALTYVVMQTTGVVEIENDGNVHDGMMLDVDDALASAEKSPGGIDRHSQLGIDELRRIKKDNDRARDRALEIFTSSSVRDILPVLRDDKGEVRMLLNMFCRIIRHVYARYLFLIKLAPKVYGSRFT